MKKNLFKGSLFTVGASLWWGVIGVLYFKFVSFATAVELAIHRTIWTALLLLITTTYLSKWKEFNKIIKKRINLIILFFTGLLISINWLTWLYAVQTNNLLDGALGYYIFPILSVFFGIIFLKSFNSSLKTVDEICSSIISKCLPDSLWVISSPQQKTILVLYFKACPYNV